MDAKYAYEIVGIYSALNEGVRVIERLATRTDFLGKSKKRSIIGGDLNLLYVDRKGNVNGINRG
jgi:hypothetical protein